jgi:hypothetical protein
LPDSLRKLYGAERKHRSGFSVSWTVEGRGI